jgi:hypothetical protein
MVSVQLGFLRRSLSDLVLEVRVIKGLGQGRGDPANRIVAHDQAILVVGDVIFMNLLVQIGGNQEVLQVATDTSPDVKLTLALANDRIKSEL